MRGSIAVNRKRNNFYLNSSQFSLQLQRSLVHESQTWISGFMPSSSSTVGSQNSSARQQEPTRSPWTHSPGALFTFTESNTLSTHLLTPRWWRSERRPVSAAGDRDDPADFLPAAPETWWPRPVKPAGRRGRRTLTRNTPPRHRLRRLPHCRNTDDMRIYSHKLHVFPDVHTSLICVHSESMSGRG